MEVNKEKRRENLRELLERIASQLEKDGIKYWLDYGTLLGATREGDIILWDEDVDLGCLDIDRKRIENSLSKIKEIRWYKGFKNTGFQAKFIKDKEVKDHLDIFLWVENGDIMKRMYYIGMDKPTGTDVKKGRDFLKKWIEKTSKRKIKDREYPVPENPEMFCEFRYGKAWKTPMTVGQWNKTDPEENLTIKI